MILFKKVLKYIENKYRDVGGCNTSYDEFEYFCRKVWEEECSYLCIDRSQRNRGETRICYESTSTYIEWNPEKRPF